MDLFEHADTRALAREGMKRAADHADAVYSEPKWTDQAFDYFRRYAKTHAMFMTEDVRVWSYENGLPHDPAQGKSWGTVAVRACRDKVVVSDHMAPTKIPPAHSCKRDVWKSLILGGVEVTP
jgi:hypothetical protein